MRIVFMGSTDFSCHCLDALLTTDEFDLVGVVTQPDSHKGRRLRVEPSPVGARFGGRDLKFLTPVNVNAPESVAAVRELKPEVVTVVAYGRMLKGEVLEIPPMGCVNVHASLLPKYRGAAPIQWAIVRGEKTTGVTTMAMTERMDAGDIMMQRAMPIGEDDTAGSMHEKLGRAGASLLVQTLRRIRAGTVERIPQNETEATYAPKLSKQDGYIDWTRKAREICDWVRGMNPWPGSSCEVPLGSGNRLKILRVRVESASGAPGEVVGINRDGPLVAAGDGAVRLIEVQPEGRKPMSGGAYLCGHRLSVGARLG